MIMGTKPGTSKKNILQTKFFGTAQVHEVLNFNKFCSLTTNALASYQKVLVMMLQGLYELTPQSCRPA